MAERFFEEGDEYVVLLASGQRLIPAADGKLVETYFNVDAEDESDGAVVALVIERQAAAGAYRTFVPIGPGVIVKRAKAEPVEPTLEPFRVPEQAIALVVPEVSGFPDDPEPVAWHIPRVGPSAAVVLVHSHPAQIPTGRMQHGAIIPRADLEHEHVLLAFEDPRHPLHTHDDAHGLTPIYGQGPLTRASRAAEREPAQS